MKKTNYKWLIFVLILFIACEEDSDDSNSNSQTGLELIEGTYYEEGHYYRHLKVVNDGDIIQVYVVADEPNSYCEYENRGELTSNPSTGFVVEEKWYKFYALDTWCSTYLYRVVQQKDNSTIVVRGYSSDFESAYNLGTSTIFKK